MQVAFPAIAKETRLSELDSSATALGISYEILENDVN